LHLKTHRAKVILSARYHAVFSFGFSIISFLAFAWQSQHKRFLSIICKLRRIWFSYTRNKSSYRMHPWLSWKCWKIRFA